MLPHPCGTRSRCARITESRASRGCERQERERGLLSEDKTLPSHLCHQHKAREPVSEAMSMHLLVFSKNMPGTLAALREKCSSGNFKRGKIILLNLLLLLCFLHFLNVLLKIEGKLMICTSKENSPCDG